MTSAPLHVNRTVICNICGGTEFAEYARRSDGNAVLICQQCGMGVLELFPGDASVFYDDDYYANYQTDGGVGYSDYNTTSEHGVLWASELVKLIKREGRVLDVGCANGFLLQALGNAYELYGIEANEKAARCAELVGARIIGHDILDEDLPAKYFGYFDAITAIAVFEHIADFRGAIEASLQMLKPDGVLIFEVPLVSEVNSNSTWLQTSLEHLFYPTLVGIRHLFDVQLKTPLIGGELVIVDYASTFVGITMRRASIPAEIAHVIGRVFFQRPENLSTQERRAQLLFKVVHAADTQPEQIAFIHELFEFRQTVPFLSRCLDLWKATSFRLHSTAAYLADVEGAKQWHAGNAVARLSERDVALSRQDAALSERDVALSERNAALSERDTALSERNSTLLELHTVYRSTSWRSTKPLRRGAVITRSIVDVAGQGLRRGLGMFTQRRVKKGFVLLRKGSVKELAAAFSVVAKGGAQRGPRGAIPETIPPVLLSSGQPLISVVIPCFNYGSFVVDAIDSILQQTLKDVEVIVVDGGSTDDSTLKTLRSLHRPRTQVLFREGRHLVGENRNYGIEKACGRYVCCLDADDTLHPTYLEKAVFILETYGYDIVSTAINFVGGRKGHIDTLPYPELSDMVGGNHVLTCAVFRRDLWALTGGYFDIGLGSRHVAEDWDFWLRLAASGARIRNISGEYLFNYRIHEAGSLSSASDVKPLADQQASILERNKDLLTSESFRLSSERQGRYFRSDPSHTALVQSVSSVPSAGRKTLLLAIPYTLIGGAERLLSGLCIYLAEHQWRVIVIRTLPQDRRFGSSIDWFIRSSSEVYSLPDFLEPREWGDFVHYLLASRRPDCLLNAGSQLVYELLPVIKAKYATLGVVDLLFNTVGHVASHLKYREQFSLALAENRDVLAWYLDVAHWPSERVRTVSSGVDLTSFAPTNRPKELVDKYGLADDELVVGFSGRLSSEKSPEVFVELATLCYDVPNVRFIMTGAGPMDASISKQVQALPPSARFEFAGLVDDVASYLALYDVLILPSRFDGRPLVVMEALASGVVVVASAVGGLPDLIDDGNNGYLVPAANVQAFADRIRALAGDRTLLKRLKAAARRTAEELLDCNRAYRDYESALLDALEISTNEG